jgi:hypothetical protein
MTVCVLLLISEGFATGLGAVIAVFIFLKVPSWLTKTFTEFDPIWNTVSPGELMFWSVSVLSIISGIFAFFSLPRNVTTVVIRLTLPQRCALSSPFRSVLPHCRSSFKALALRRIP